MFSRTLCGNGQLKRAFETVETLNPNTWIFLESSFRLLQECTKTNAIAEGKRIHANTMRSLVDPNMIMWNTLINMYVKCGRLEEACDVVNSMPMRNEYIWTSIIAGYAQNGNGRGALKIFQHMKQEGVLQNKVTFVCALNACICILSVQHGKQFHASILKAGYGTDDFVANTLVHMYTKCASIEDAWKIFERVNTRGVFMWTTIIAGYAEIGNCGMSLGLFAQMLVDRVQPNEFTFLSVLEACSVLERAKHIHSYILSTNYKLDMFVTSSLVCTYIKSGGMHAACDIFDRLPKRDVVSWNTMIGGHVEGGYGREALCLFRHMIFEGMKPNEVTLSKVLAACSVMDTDEEGKYVHSIILRAECQQDAFVCRALIDMYAKTGRIEDACQSFNTSVVHNVYICTTMIGGYAEQGYGREALKTFEQMQQEGMETSEITLVATLNACSRLHEGKCMHARIVKVRPKLDSAIYCALIDMYVKHGSIGDAYQIFYSLSIRNIIIWTTMIVGYSEQGYNKEALELFQQMQAEGMKPNNITLLTLLNVCGSLASLDGGKYIHANVLQNKHESDCVLGSALADMYAKCGNIKDACIVFDRFMRDAVSWNIMLSAYAQHGNGEAALDLVVPMLLEGIRPNKVTFISLLHACGHAQLTSEGCHYFSYFSQDHGVALEVQHYACMVDLLGRVGWLDEAHQFIGMMPCLATADIWMFLLSACRIYGVMSLAEDAVVNVLMVEPTRVEAYLLLSSIYAMVNISPNLNVEVSSHVRHDITICNQPLSRSLSLGHGCS